jgi:hypothetical protein
MSIYDMPGDVYSWIYGLSERSDENPKKKIKITDAKQMAKSKKPSGYRLDYKIEMTLPCSKPSRRANRIDHRFEMVESQWKDAGYVCDSTSQERAIKELDMKKYRQMAQVHFDHFVGGRRFNAWFDRNCSVSVEEVPIY